VSDRSGPPWRHIAAALSVALVAGALARVAPVHDAVTGAAVPGARLVLPPAYVALAPLCDLADALAALPLHAHYALMLSILAGGLAWPARRVAWRVGRAVGVLLGVYVVAVLVPRPVARLTVDDPDAVIVDFHSHTSASHDGRHGFSAEANRAWHAAAGFDVAYVTDHATFAGVVAGAARNPRHAGDGTVLLPGVEVRRAGQHLNVLGTRPADSLAYAGGELHDGVFIAQAGAYDVPRVVLLTMPVALRVPNGPVVLDAVEISDGAPRGLEQSDRDRGVVTAFADRSDLALLAGSDNHGWATNAVAWSVLRIPGWRAMTPDALDRAIRRTIWTRGRVAVQVVERRDAVVPSGSLAAPMDEVPARLWALCRALSWPERLAWLVWLWVPALLAARLRARYFAPPSTIGSSPSRRSLIGAPKFHVRFSSKPRARRVRSDSW